jgi:CBS domain-containing protein
MDYRARDIMNSEVVAVSTDMDLRDLAKLLLDKEITGAPVVDSEGHLVGVVSQHDLVNYALTRDDELVMDSQFYQSARMEGSHIPKGYQIEDTNTARVSDVMTPIVHSVTEDAPLETVARLMTGKHIHRVIVRKGRKLAGIISALDVLRTHIRRARTAGKKASRKGARKGSKKTSKKGTPRKPRKSAKSAKKGRRA